MIRVAFFIEEIEGGHGVDNVILAGLRQVIVFAQIDGICDAFTGFERNVILIGGWGTLIDASCVGDRLTVKLDIK